MLTSIAYFIYVELFEGGLCICFATAWLHRCRRDRTRVRLCDICAAPLSCNSLLHSGAHKGNRADTQILPELTGQTASLPVSATFLCLLHPARNDFDSTLLRNSRQRSLGLCKCIASCEASTPFVAACVSSDEDPPSTLEAAMHRAHPGPDVFR